MLILKNLLRRRTRTLLSLLGIAIGIAAIIAFNAVALRPTEQKSQIRSVSLRFCGQSRGTRPC